MRYAMRLAVVSCVWFLGCTSVIQAQDAEPRAKGSEGLYSSDEQELLEYLAGRTIPFYDNQGAGNAPPITDPMFQDQVKRALEVFKAGSPRLRLAIAKSLCWAPDSEAVGFWKACGPDDAEAQQYLFGVVLANAPDEMKTTLRQWLLEEADLKYAPALLKNLYGGDLFADTDAAEQEEIFAFLKRLYKQQGVVVRYKGPDEETTISGSVQEYVVRLLPETEQAWDTLLEWMTADARTADEGTLRAMWERWQSMNAREMPLKDKAFFEAAAENTAVAEAWCLSPFRPSLSDQVPEAMRGFERTVWSQVFSEDERVRRSIITSLLNGSAYWHRKPSEFLKSLDVPVPAREQAASDAHEIYLRLKESKEYAESEELASRLDKRFETLNAALQP